MAPHSTHTPPRTPDVEDVPESHHTGHQSQATDAQIHRQFPGRPIDETAPIKAIVVGAGLAGITAGILLPAKVPGLQLTIYEKNPDVGGAWYENRYPGVRCDIPAHVYQSTISPNTVWTEKYATGPEIQRYWRSVAEKHDVLQYVKLSHRVQSASWNTVKKHWDVVVKDLLTGATIHDSANVFITAVGHFNDWKLPEYPGIGDFKGHIRHSSNWDPEFRPEGKRVAVIGNGASGLQVVPQLQKLASHLDHYARSPTWIATSFAGPPRSTEPEYFTPSEIASFSDPSTYHRYRKSQESIFFRNFSVIFQGSRANTNLRTHIIQSTEQRLRNKPGLLSHILPTFSPSCRRITPGPGYLEALTQENVTYITTPISHITNTGIITNDGVHREVDAIICCTGAKLTFTPFPITALSTTLSDAWSSTGPETYLGVAAAGFPNLFFLGGANASAYSGTTPHSTETQVTYIARVLRKLATDGYASVVPKMEAVDDFTAYSTEFWKSTVFAEECSSWYKSGTKDGRVTGLWPGSAWHAAMARREPRWEDFEWEVRNEGRGNRFWYFGNGWTRREWELRARVESGEEGEDVERLADGLTGYLKTPGEIDLRMYHEEWYEGRLNGV